MIVLYLDDHRHVGILANVFFADDEIIPKRFFRRPQPANDNNALPQRPSLRPR